MFLKVVASAMVAFSAVSCTTGYDAYGAPRQSVDPLAAAAVAGVAGYAIGQNNRPKYYYGGGYYGPRYGYYGRNYARPVPFRGNFAARRAYYLRHH